MLGWIEKSCGKGCVDDIWRTAVEIETIHKGESLKHYVGEELIVTFESWNSRGAEGKDGFNGWQWRDCMNHKGSHVKLWLEEEHEEDEYSIVEPNGCINYDFP
jgi:hypothetical protein